VWQARPPQHATCSSTRCGSCILSPPTSVWPPAPPGAASSPLATRQPLSLSLSLPFRATRMFYECGGEKARGRRWVGEVAERRWDGGGLQGAMGGGGLGGANTQWMET
jgi:hypothetical protein